MTHFIAGIAVAAVSWVAASAHAAQDWMLVDIGTLGGAGSYGAAVSDSGIVVGCSDVRSGGAHAFVYRNGVIQDLGQAKAINSRNQVAGTSKGRAFLYESGRLRDLGTLGGNISAARGINVRGEIVGMSTDSFGSPASFIYHGTMQALPGNSYSTAIAINNRGQVVGSGEGIFGFLIEGDKVTRLDRLPAVVAKGWRRLEPTGINERGWIVGTAVNPEGDLRAFLLVPVHEEHAKPVRLRTK